MLSSLTLWTKDLRGLLLLPLVNLFSAVAESRMFYGASLKDLRRRALFMFRYIRGWYLYHCFVRHTHNFRKVQDKLVQTFIQTNAGSEYSKLNHLDGREITSVEKLASLHPISSYDTYSTSVERMSRGEQNVLTTQKLHCFAFTSGTTGKSKMIPVSRSTMEDFINVVMFKSFYISVRFNRKLLEGRKFLRFTNPVARKITESGLGVGAVSGFVPGFEPCTNDTTTPIIPLHKVKDKDVTYIHLLFGLLDRRVVTIQSTFASFLHTNLAILEERWPQLVADIAEGRISLSLELADDVRSEIQRHLSPNPGRASELRTEFERGFTGIVKRIWPEVELALAATSASFRLYVDILSAGYLKGVPIYSSFYGASESCFAFNLFGPEEGEPRYVLWPNSAVYEFIPFDVAGTPEQYSILPEKGEIGQEYEIVITNNCGFYRYAMGDVVRLVGFFNQAPIVHFVYRRGQLLSIRGEKTSETAIYTSLSTASKQHDVTLVDYTCAESGCLQDKASGDAPHYVIFVEIREDRQTDDFVNLLQQSVEEHLCATAQRYAFYRQTGALETIQLHLVKHGAFLRLRDFRLMTSQGSANQIKAARLLVSLDQIQLMLNEIEV